MAVPKASVHKDDLAAAWKNQVWTTWQVLRIQSITISKSVNHAAHCHLGLGILLANALHDASALFG
jgi:hypothetical protein